MSAIVQSLALGWYQVKLFLQHASGISMDALHVIIGVVMLFACAQLLKTTVAKPLPLLPVLILAILNEASDLRAELWPQLAMQLGEGAKDISLTMAVPVLIFLVARLRPSLLTNRADERAATATPHVSGPGEAE